MKKNTLLLIFLCLGFSIAAQNATKLRIDTTDINMLVDLAFENSFLIKQNDIAIEKLASEREFVKNDWLDMISISGNLNEVSLQETFGTADENRQNLFFPRYNFGIGIQIGTLTGMKHKKRMFTKDIETLQEEEQILRTELEKEIKLAYYNYLIFKEKYAIKKSFQELATASFNTTEQRFLEGDVMLDEFYTARENYSNFTIDLLEAEENFLIAKVNLETLIGVSIDDLDLALNYSSGAARGRN